MESGDRLQRTPVLMRWRDLTVYGWVVSIVLGASGFAWLTRNPESEILENAERWPVVGPLARRFRLAYLPSGTPSLEEAAEPRRTRLDESGARELSLDDRLGARPRVWVQAGVELHTEPDHQSPVVDILGMIQNPSVLSQQGDWYRVRIPRLGGDPALGWIFLEDYQEPTSGELRQPAPVLPLVANSLDPQRFSLVRRVMSGGGHQRACGPYSLYTDVEQHPLITVCPRLTVDIEEAYRKRFGLEPVSPPAETILLFETAAEYRRFRDLDEVETVSNLAHASPSSGYLALYIEDQTVPATLETLTHELVHLLNHRSLGPALPSWLSEGLADDLAQSRIDVDGSLHAGELGGESRTDGGRVVRSGGLATVIGLQDALDRGALPALVDLVEMDRDRFYEAEKVQLHYGLSSAWVRYLLSDFDADLAIGFRAFLRQVAAGRYLSGGLLQQSVGKDWAELETGFHTWLRLQYLTPLNEIRERSQ